jgi:predicted nucleic acid-binding protein
LTGSVQPLFGNALWWEYRDLMQRPVWGVEMAAAERVQILSALAKRGRWVTIYFGWRPNLPDESDNHLIELAIAGGGATIITHNLRDFRRGDLQLGIRVVTPAQFLEEIR